MKFVSSLLKASLPMVLALLATGCTHNIRFEVEAPSINEGVFLIKNLADSTIYGSNIRNGHSKLEQPMIEQPGYYSLQIIDNKNRRRARLTDIYLEPGQYHVKVAQNMGDYPEIISTSHAQQELSNYYRLYATMKQAATRQFEMYNKQLNSDSAALLAHDDYVKLVNNVTRSRNKRGDVTKQAFRKYIKTYPESKVTAHLMQQFGYEDDPVAYYKIFKQLNPDVQHSEEGEEIGNKLERLMKLIPGALAPDITGTTPDGKPFDKKTLTKKLYLIEFWKIGNDLARASHPSLALMINAEFGVISINLNKQKDWWTDAIKEDQMTWPQYSDLKGNDSDNVTNWNVTTLPTYYLVDRNWHIVEHVYSSDQLSLAVNDYFRNHK